MPPPEFRSTSPRLASGLGQTNVGASRVHARHLDNAGRIALVLLALASGGCQSVPPWDRGNLAKPQMSDEPHPSERRVADHIYRSREAAPGGVAAEGGGCGCY